MAHNMKGDKINDYRKVASRFSQIGRSMIEMLGVLAIIGVLSVAGIAGYSKAMKQYQINETTEQISLIANALYSTQKDYSELSLETEEGINILKKSEVIPDEMWDDEC